MKKLLLILYLGLISITLLNSCEKNLILTKEQPTLKVTMVGGTVITGDTLFLVIPRDTTINVKYEINTTGQIKWLYQTLNDIETLIPESEGKSAFDKTLSFLIPAVNANYSFSVKITNSEGGRLSKKVVIAVKKFIPPVLNDGSIIIHTNRVVGGDASSLPSRFDLDLGLTAGNVADPIIKASADLHYNLLSFSERVGSSTYPNGMGSKFGTTGLSATGFNSIITSTDISQYTANLSVINIEVGKVYVCKTNQGKKALILIKSLNTTTDEITFDVKIQKDVPLKTFTNVVVAGQSGTSPLSARIDLDTGTPITNLNDPVQKAACDLQYDLLTLSERVGSVSFPTGMGSKFGATTLNEAGFNNIKPGDMAQFTATQSIINIAVGGVYAVITNQNKKALIYIKSRDASSKDEVTFDIKIQD